MRKRQVKKFAKAAKKNMKPYRDAYHGGSKKLDRRRRAFGRYSGPGGLASWDAARRMRARVSDRMARAQTWAEMGDVAGALVEFLGITSEEVKGPAA